MRAVIVGAVESTHVAIEEIAKSGWELALVVTLPPEAASRHSDFVDLAPAAARAGAAVHHCRQVNDAATLEAIRAAAPDYLFIIGWSQICGPELMATCPDRVIGYHPAALPRMRGRAAIPWTIILDEPISAGTLFWIDAGVDSGPILEQHFFHIAPDETAATLYDKHMDALRIMLPRALAGMANGTPRRTVQDERCATYAARRTPEDGRIDWQRSAVEIDRLVRAVSRPYPGATTQAGKQSATIWRTTPLREPSRHHAMPGQIVARDEGRAVVQTGDGLLRIDEWTLEEGREPAMHIILGRMNG